MCGHDDEKREWHVDVKQDLLALESRSDVNVRNTKFQDQFNCMVSLSNLSRIMTTEFYYSSRAGSNETEMEFKLELLRVVEFHSSDVNMIYEGNVSTIASFWPPEGKLDWTKWASSEYSANGVMHRAWETSSGDGILTFRVHISILVANETSAKFDPNSVKIDIKINQYPYTSPGNTRLALEAKISSKTKTKALPCARCRVAVDKLSFEDDAGLPMGIIKWKPTSFVNNVSTIPIAAFLADESHHHRANIAMYYNFMTFSDAIHSRSLLWETSLGIEYSRTPGFCLGALCGAGAIAVLVLFGLIGAFLVVSAIYGTYTMLYKKKNEYEEINDGR